MTCVAAISTRQDVESARREVIGRLAETMKGAPADLAVVFGSSHHAQTLEALGLELRDQRLARHVLGCTGESIIGDGLEIEESPALSIWTIRCPGMQLQPFRFVSDEISQLGTPLPPTPTLLMLGDPYSFRAERFLQQFDSQAPGGRVIGGMASVAGAGRNRLLVDGDVYSSGAVAMAIGGSVAVRTIVSQGCRPIGRPLIVTRAEGNLLRELGRRPALDVLREIYASLDPEDQDLVQRGLHIGQVINEYQETFQRGDFLVRNVMGADEAGGIAIGDAVRVGRTVQFHVRDADTADEDLRSLLDRESAEHGSAKIQGALIFSCNGRGTRLFSTPNHDAATLHRVLGPIPTAGFFAMGELGPVGGQNFIHGFTASIALFECPSSSVSAQVAPSPPI